MERPNVLLIYTDQQRWDTINYGGNTAIFTPNLDRLAKTGAMFKNAFCNNPVCMPSRQSMLSGQYPSAIGTMDNGIEMREDVPTAFTMLKPYGYNSANIGKLHFKNHSNRDHRDVHPSYGIDTLIVSDEPGCYDDAYIKWVQSRDSSQVYNCRCSTPPVWKGKPINKQPRGTTTPYVFEGQQDLTHSVFVAEETINYLRQHKDSPFFAVAGFYAPHPPLNPPRKFVDMYDVDALPLPNMSSSQKSKLNLSDSQWRKIKAYYYALITHVDDQVGRILKAVDELGLRDNTIIIFTSDHGEHLGDHGQVHKNEPGYDSCTRVPLIVSYPKAIKASIPPEIIEAVDIVPTILDYCGIQQPPLLQGRSFKPLLDGNTYKKRDSAYIEFRTPFGVSTKTVRTRDLWYCLFNDNEKSEQLFDLKNDPHQLYNVADESDYRQALCKMRRELLIRLFDVEKQYPLQTGQY